eukprot:TRINITY_DN3470_c0_g1_i1.p1 TRINITY_DN3470_c0_g1~~TRINITY_DN3470_c0_g1_i1.p1  ORF type:complete len:130 (-),score=17.48 TRINITY_DN3470_c0_g1_i1:56-445(-)
MTETDVVVSLESHLCTDDEGIRERDVKIVRFGTTHVHTACAKCQQGCTVHIVVYVFEDTDTRGVSITKGIYNCGKCLAKNKVHPDPSAVKTVKHEPTCGPGPDAGCCNMCCCIWTCVGILSPCVRCCCK